MQVLDDSFTEAYDGYLCKQFPDCDNNKEIAQKLVHTTVEALEVIGIG